MDIRRSVGPLPEAPPKSPNLVPGNPAHPNSGRSRPKSAAEFQLNVQGANHSKLAIKGLEVLN